MEYTVVRDVPSELVERAKRKCRDLEISANKVELKFNRSLTEVTVIDIEEHSIVARFRLEPLPGRPASEERETPNAENGDHIVQGESAELGEVPREIRQPDQQNVKRVRKKPAK